MASIRAFRAYRYNLGRVGSLADVVAPPYDVIDAGLQDKLYQRSPYNVIRLILDRELPTDTETDNRYTRSARFLRNWQQDGILSEDSAPSLYVYHQEFDVEGGHCTRKGFLARVRLEKFGEGKIYPHEETMAGPKADRLKLFRATAMNLSPVFGLYPDEQGGVQPALDAAIRRAPPLEATDHLGVVNRLWPISDQHTINQVASLMAAKPVFIADGHHRYETGLRYLEERREAGDVPDDEAAPNFILMMLVSMSDPGLVILPTHRLVSALSGVTAEQLRKMIGEHFQLETIGTGAKGARDTWEMMEADGTQDVLGFGTVSDDTWQFARLQSAPWMTALAPDHSPAWRNLAVSVLHVMVLGHLLPSAKPTCRYVHLLAEVTDAVSRKECQLAVLVPPASMDHVEKIAGNLEKMPPKSTYFYPKLLSGLVLNSLKGH